MVILIQKSKDNYSHNIKCEIEKGDDVPGYDIDSRYLTVYLLSMDDWVFASRSVRREKVC